MPRARHTSGVMVVTDSTAYLPSGAADAMGVRVVPLQVIVSGGVRSEGAEIGPAEVADALRHGHAVSTSRPSPTLFAAAYAVVRRYVVRQSWRPLLNGLAIAGAVCLPLVVGALAWQFAGPQSYRSVLHGDDAGNSPLALLSFA